MNNDDPSKKTSKSQKETIQGPPISLDDCKNYLSDKTFQLRPPYYSARYPIWPGTVGLEVEMLPFRGEAVNSIVPLNPQNSLSFKKNSSSFSEEGMLDLTSVLFEMGESKGWRANASLDHNPKTNLGSGQDLVTLIHLEAGDNLSFEPGGQLEHSTLPYPCLSDAVRRVKKMQKYLDTHLRPHGISLRHLGINPYHSVKDIGLQMNKKRYAAMDQFFSSIGPWGARMMRQTCTVQVCLDFGENEQVMAKRFFVSLLLSPYVQAIFANSPFKDGKLFELDGLRAKTWKDIDSSRTGALYKSLSQIKADPEGFEFTKKTCVDAYLEFLLGSYVVFVEALNFKIPDKKTTFLQWVTDGIDGVYPTIKDLETQLSLLFPEVRPKGFIELRSADAQDRAWQFVPAAFYTGILYNPKTLDQVLDLLIPIADQTEELLLKAQYGLKDQQLFETAKKIFKLSLEGFNNLPSCFREKETTKAFSVFYTEMTEKGATPASEMRRALTERGLDQLDDATWRMVSDRWAGLVKT